MVGSTVMNYLVNTLSLPLFLSIVDTPKLTFLNAMVYKNFKFKYDLR
jgi:hypothetical protein